MNVEGIRFLNQNVTIINAQSPSEVANLLEMAGRTCYKSESRGNPEEFIKKLIERGHESVIEHINFTVKFTTNRGVTHELVRHRIASYSQESTRYCNYNGEMKFIYPVWVNKSFEDWVLEGCETLSSDGEFYASCVEAANRYRSLLSKGWRPEEAREVLPNALATDIVVTANAREWRHIFKLRTSNKSHPQIRFLMTALLLSFSTMYPFLFEDLK
ncbi:MAG: thymidylate synthase [Candidatus Woesearchaeota archaeon]|nr:MAG: thymidylate synthase [Candidatus Woesearchaeota archaeon]